MTYMQLEVVFKVKSRAQRLIKDTMADVTQARLPVEWNTPRQHALTEEWKLSDE